MKIGIHPSGKYTAYPEYIDSGVQMLGALPATWQIRQVRYLLRGGAEGIKIGPFGSALKLEDMVESGAKVYGQENVIKKDFSLGKRRISQSKLQEMQVYKIYPDDLLITMMGTSGKCELVPQNAEVGIIDSHLLRMRVKEAEILPRYFRLLIDECYEIESQIKISGKGSIMHGLNSSIVKSLTLPLPTRFEQEIILNFLDHETAKIDTLIEKQQQLIKLLKEKRQAVISHAVTKGLNPNVPMRDSGVEWLGEMPGHWTVRRLKHTSKLQSGIPKGRDLTGKVSINVPMLRVANVQDGYLDLGDIHKIDIEPDQLERYTLKKGDVLMNEGGDNDKLGRGAVWQCEIEPCIHQNHVFSIRPYSIEPEWLDLLTRASYAKFHFFRVAKQSTNLASISSTNIKETPLVIPPENERQKIIDYTHEKIDAFDKAERKCSVQIALLQERRTALISAAVTGKIDVRNWVVPRSSNNANSKNKEVTP